MTLDVQVYGLSAGQVTAFRYHGGLQVLPVSIRGVNAEKTAQTELLAQTEQPKANCPWLIVDADAEVALGVNVDLRPWKFVTKVRRPSDDNEDVLLYRRTE